MADNIGPEAARSIRDCSSTVLRPANNTHRRPRFLPTPTDRRLIVDGLSRNPVHDQILTPVQPIISPATCILHSRLRLQDKQTFRLTFSKSAARNTGPLAKCLVSTLTTNTSSAHLSARYCATCSACDSLLYTLIKGELTLVCWWRCARPKRESAEAQLRIVVWFLAWNFIWTAP